MLRLPSIGAAALAIALILPPAARAHAPATEMAEAARAFLAALDSTQRERATYPLEDPERFNWHFIPRSRKGISWKDLGAAQRHLATALLASGMSQRGFVKATTIMSLEQILLDLEQGRGPNRDPEDYYWTIFGQPTTTGTWGWRVEGHHLSVNFTLVKGHHVASTPSFFGTNPAEVRSGPRAGLRVLAAEEDIGRQLILLLPPERRRVAVVSETAPPDILTGAQRKATPLSPDGLAAARMNAEEKNLLRALIEEFVRRSRQEVADAHLARIDEAGFDQIHFAWAGSVLPGQGHYYRVQGPTFLLEYDNTQNNANHIHAVWRDFNGDFGEDILARHYEETPH